MPDDQLPTPPESIHDYPHPVFYAWGVLPDGRFVLNAFDTTRPPSGDESMPEAMRYCVMGMTLTREDAIGFLSRILDGVANRVPFSGVAQAALFRDFDLGDPDPTVAAQPDRQPGEGPA